MLKKITQQELKESLYYNPKTGDFTWINHKKNSSKNGTNARRKPDSYGYYRIRVNGCQYRAHRLAWLYMTGEMPKEQIDHINQNKADNRFSNLRDVSSLENQRNRSLTKNNKSGSVGINWIKQLRKYRAQITVNQKSIHLGLFKGKEDAIKARKHAEKIYGFHENHGKRLTNDNI